MRVVLPMPGNEALAARLAALAGAELGEVETRRFPDGESYVRLRTDVSGRHVDVVCTLARPDEQFLALVFAADAARELGALSVNLVAPYLAYMRQDARFQSGEAVSSVSFARLISGAFDSLVTVDPHLHRRRSLDEIFSVPTRVEHAAALLGAWVRGHVERPLLIGPDAESEQWVSAAARVAAAPYAVLRKQRLGDRAVQIEAPDLTAHAGLQPVILDDVASSGRTLVEAARTLARRGFAAPVCVVVHAVFAQDAVARIREVSPRLVSTDTVPHDTNAISIAPLLTTLSRRG